MLLEDAPSAPGSGSRVAGIVTTLLLDLDINMVERAKLDEVLKEQVIQLTHGEEHLFLPPVRPRFTPRLNGALDERLLLVGNDQRGVIAQNVAETFAFRTSSQRMIERKQHGPKRLKRAPAALAAKSRMVGAQSLPDHVNRATAVAFTEGRLNRFAET